MVIDPNLPQDDASFEEVTRADQLKLKNKKGSTAKTQSPPAKKLKILKRASKQRLKGKRQSKRAQVGKKGTSSWNWDDSTWDCEQDAAWTDEAYWQDADWWAWEAADWGAHSASPKSEGKCGKKGTKDSVAKTSAKAKAKSSKSPKPKTKAAAKAKATSKAKAAAKAKTRPGAKGKAKAKASPKRRATARPETEDEHDSPASRRARSSRSSRNSNPESEGAPSSRRGRPSTSSGNSNPRQPEHSERDVRALLDCAKLFGNREFRATMKPEMKEKVGCGNLAQCALNVYWTRCSCGVTCKAPSKDVAYFFFSSTDVGFTPRLCVALKSAQIFVSRLQLTVLYETVKSKNLLFLNPIPLVKAAWFDDFMANHADDEISEVLDHQDVKDKKRVLRSVGVAAVERLAGFP